MLKIIIINFFIACIGFGSGTVFISYTYEAYTRFTNISTTVIDLSIAIGMALPAPFTPKMLALITFQEYGFWQIWPALLAFVMPTVIIASFTFKNYNKFKHLHFFKQLSRYFPPLMAAITTYVILLLTIQNINTPTELKYFLAPFLCSLVLRYLFKSRSNGLLLIANTFAILLVTII